MFLFLSKLLPLFIYPLGLVCLLILVALLTLWKRPRIATLSLLLALAMILISSNAGVVTAMTRSLEQQYIPTGTLPTADAIVVLGGALRQQIPPRPMVEVMESGDRVLYAAQLYRQGKAPLVILSGGRIPWMGGGTPESEDMATLLAQLGVPASAMVQDPTSLNTYENAVNVRELLQERGLKQVLLVTSATHMPRSMKIFQKQGIEAIAAPTDFLVTEDRFTSSGLFEEKLLNVLPDAERLDQFTRILKEYIGRVVYQLRGWL